MNSFYKRKEAPGHKPTEVPGMNSAGANQNSSTQKADTGYDNTQAKDIKTEDPVVGFLYSISRNGSGEYWPLHIGKNIIGRDSDCDIRLRERTVTGKHAMIASKIMKKDGRVIASIQDIGSKNGVSVNDEEIEYGAVPLTDGDRILIGNAYELLLILINPAERGLKPNPDFSPDTDDSDDQEDVNDPFNNQDDTDDFYNSANRNATGTVNLEDGAGFQTGNTKFI